MTISPETLCRHLDTLNTVRNHIGQPSLSYSDVGHAVGISKSTAHAILAGTYTSANATVHATAILKWLATELKALDDSDVIRNAPPGSPRLRGRIERALFTAEKLGLIPSTRPAASSAGRRIRVSTTGYFQFSRQTYYAGSPFTGSRVRVRRDRDSDYVRVSGDGFSKLCRPVDPTTSQLGYTPESGR